MFTYNGLEAATFGSMSFIDRTEEKKVKPQNGIDAFGAGSMSFIGRDTESNVKNIFPILSLEINDQCSLSCRHCLLNGRVLARPGLSEHFLSRILEDLGHQNFQIPWASFSGMEPTETPERLLRLAEIVHKYSSTILMTNAVRLTPSFQKKLHPVIDYLDPSLDGIDDVEKAMLKNGRETEAFQNIKFAANNKIFKKIGIIITTNARTCQRLAKMLDCLGNEFSHLENVIPTVWFHVGRPGDQLLLSKEQFIEVAQMVAAHGYKKIQICVPGIYTPFLPSLFEKIKVEKSTLRFCSQSGIPSYLVGGGQRLVIPSEAENPFLLRVDYDGFVYLGCNHAALGEGNVSQSCIGDLTKESLGKIFQTMIDYRH